MDLKLIFAAIATILVNTNGACLHNGCEMSGGLLVDKINTQISSLLNDAEYIDNVLQVVSWNVKNQFDDNKWVLSDNDVCKFLKKMQPLILGLQEVNPKQSVYLKSCLKDYSFVDGESSSPLQNLIVYRNSRRLRIVKSGHFTISNGRQSSCTWARFQFADRLNGNPLQYLTGSKSKLTEKLSRILNFLLPQKRSSHFHRSIESFYGLKYKWYNFYVAVVKVNSVSEVDAQTQLKSILDQMRYSKEAMDRRRYPLIVLLDLGKEDNSLAYKYFESRNWLKNTMENSIINLPAMSSLNENDPSSEMLSDSIWEARFHGVISAVISDPVATQDGVSTHRPVFSSLLRHRRGRR